jgi:hypothetical protein
VPLPTKQQTSSDGFISLCITTSPPVPLRCPADRDSLYGILQGQVSVINGDPDDPHLQQLLTDIQQQIDAQEAALAAAAAAGTDGASSSGDASLAVGATNGSSSRTSAHDSNSEPFHWPDFIAVVEKVRESHVARGGRRVGICITKGSPLDLADFRTSNEAAMTGNLHGQDGGQVGNNVGKQDNAKKRKNLGADTSRGAAPAMTLWSQVKKVSTGDTVQ